MNRILYMCVLLFGFVLNTDAQYKLKVGYSEYLSINPPKGSVRNSTWQCDEGLVLSDRSEVGAIVKVTHYFSGTAYVNCQYTYEYLGTYDNNWHAGTGTQTYRITCVPSNASINKTSIELTPGNTYKLSCTKSESYGTPIWESSNEDVATVDKNGLVTALQSGYARITLDPIVAAPLFCDVTVKKVSPTSVSLTPNPLSIQNGSKEKITATLYPKGATANLSWESSNENIASVSESGEVTAHKAGKTTIMVKTDNGLSSSVQVTVLKTKVKLSCSTIEDGVITKGTKVSLSADAENAKIYYSLDGSNPTRTSSLYKEPLILDGSCILKAFASAEGYLDSDMLTQEIKVTTLVVNDVYPKCGSIDVQYFVIPTVTFNDNVKEGRNFAKISLESNNKDVIEPLELNCYLFQKKLIVEPSKNLIKGDYILTIPQGAVENGRGEENVAFTCNFSTLDTPICHFINFSNSIGETSFAIKNDKSVWGCGYNSMAKIYGVKDDYNHDKFIPCYFYDLKEVKESSFDKLSYYYLQTNGKLYAKAGPYKTSYPEELLSDVKEIGIGDKHGLALKNDGSLWVWGNNSNGCFGMDTDNKMVNYPLLLMKDVRKIFICGQTSYVIKEDNSLWAWGENNYGQIGNGLMEFVKKPTYIMNDVDSIACFDYHVLAIKNDGSLWGWGQNRCGTIGLGNSNNSSVPINILNDIREVFTNRNTSYAITRNNILFTWGWNEYGQIGAGETYKYVYLPTIVLKDVSKVSLVWQSCAALKTDGTLWTCGRNQYGELGDGTKTVGKVFKQVIDDVNDFAKSSSNLIVLKNDNTLWGCGSNGSGQLGDGTTTSCSTLKQITNNVKKFIGTSHIRAYKTDGSIWTWGYNKYGVLGVGKNTESVTSPVMLQSPTSELKDAMAIYSREMSIGEHQVVDINITPKDASIKEVIWESEDPKILTINNKGILEAKQCGVVNFYVHIKTDMGMVYDLTEQVTINPSSTGIMSITNDSSDEKQISISIEANGVKITSESPLCDISLYSIDGKIIFKKNQCREIFVGKLPKGVYIVKVGRQSKKFAI